MTVSSDLQYQALARRAASRLGTSSPEIVRAILAQWQCELGNGDAYPPARNNPGNVAQGFAAGTGIPFTATMPNPQPGNPIVTFQSPEAGADAYAIGLSRFARYAPVRLAITASSGAGFLAAVTAAGYGTGLGCAMSVYGGNAGAGGGGAVSGTTPAVPASVTVSGTKLNIPFRTALVGSPFNLPASALFNDPTVGAYIDWASQFLPSDKLADGGGASVYSNEMRAILRPYIGQPVGSLPDRLGAELTAGATQSSDPFAGINFAWVPGVVVNGAVMILILILAYEGLSRLLEPA